ncbi:D-alanine--D-alanine ligase [Glaciecola sp. 2405UD65-10]|uniref:D-alanine--D-alanine ligase n=1 Tax=Glaciecola sp. 2405UD65-10 TaxID=3397244 RepID=UPI003B5927BA
MNKLSQQRIEEFGKVAVLLGGTSAEREVSLASGTAVLNALRDAGIDAHGFDPKDRNVCDLRQDGFDRVFIALHGRGGEDGTIQGTLDYLHLPYTGSGVTGSALAIDKVLTKLIWHAQQLPIAPYKVVVQDSFEPTHCASILQELGGQVMVKPSLEGSSLGMAKASNENELRQAIETAFKFDKKVLIEAFITGPEYTVSILGNEALPSISMKPAEGFYDYDAKYNSNSTQYFCPSGLSEEDERNIQSIALEAFTSLQGKGWGRVDLMRDNNGQFYLLESNTVPGMTNTSLVPKAAKQAGLSFTELVIAILMQTLED